MLGSPPGREPDRVRMVEVNAVTLRVWEWGDDDHDRPLILLGHGAFDHGRMMDGLGAALADRGFTCWSPDLRAHGGSARVPHGSTFEPMMCDIGALAQTTDRRIGLIGHSMGAGVFMQAAAVWADRFDWVVSLDSVGPPESTFETVDLAESTTMLFDQLVKAVARSARVFPDRQRMFDQRAMLNTRVPEAWMWHLVNHGSVAVDGGYRWSYDSLFNSWLPDAFRKEWVLDDFAAVRVPVLALTGGVDELWSDVPLDEIERRLAHIADVRHEIVPLAGHYVHLENEPFVVDAIERFIEEVGW